MHEPAVRQVAANSDTVALSHKRSDLVIGNSVYTYAGILPNPISDAKVIDKTIGHLVFEVITVTDVNQKMMNRFLRDFILRIHYLPDCINFNI